MEFPFVTRFTLSSQIHSNLQFVTFCLSQQLQFVCPRFTPVNLYWKITGTFIGFMSG